MMGADAYATLMLLPDADCRHAFAPLFSPLRHAAFHAPIPPLTSSPSPAIFADVVFRYYADYFRLRR